MKSKEYGEQRTQNYKLNTNESNFAILRIYRHTK